MVGQSVGLTANDLKGLWTDLLCENLGFTFCSSPPINPYTPKPKCVYFTSGQTCCNPEPICIYQKAAGLDYFREKR
jgi:hypothetical protein